MWRSLDNDFRRMQRDLEQIFGRSPWQSGIRSESRETWPPINIGSNQDQVDVYLFLAGVDTNSLDITIQQNLLVVAGERRVMTETGANYYRKERHDGDFRRVVNLPEDVDPDRVEAVYREGVLRITIQRRETAKPRSIEVK